VDAGGAGSRLRPDLARTRRALGPLRRARRGPLRGRFRRDRARPPGAREDRGVGRRAGVLRGAGGLEEGIVADSVCESEYQECFNKIGAILQLLEDEFLAD